MGRSNYINNMQCYSIFLSNKICQYESQKLHCKNIFCSLIIRAYYSLKRNVQLRARYSTTSRAFRFIIKITCTDYILELGILLHTLTHSLTCTLATIKTRPIEYTNGFRVWNNGFTVCCIVNFSFGFKNSYCLPNGVAKMANITVRKLQYTKGNVLNIHTSDLSLLIVGLSVASENNSFQELLHKLKVKRFILLYVLFASWKSNEFHWIRAHTIFSNAMFADDFSLNCTIPPK